VIGAKGKIVGQVGDGNRKDIRNAVEAAHKARTSGWAMRHGYNRSQILYFIAENLDARNAEFVERIVEMTGRTKKSAQAEVNVAVKRLFSYAAWADKYGGSVQETTLRGITVAVNEPMGVIGIACPDEYPLLGFISLMAPAIARGNTVVMIPARNIHYRQLISIKCSIRPMCLAAWSTSSQATATIWSRRSSNTKTWTRSGTSAQRKAVTMWRTNPLPT
jgi:acyl-CoA reductase-like NAD-dependent aldehyde dehydrogenase